MCDAHAKTKIPFLAKFVDVKFDEVLPEDRKPTKASANDQALALAATENPGYSEDTKDYWIANQKEIVAQYGELRLRINPLGMFKGPKAMPSYLPSHALVMMDGFGLAMARVKSEDEGIDPIHPDLLFYAPADPEKAARAGFKKGSFTDQTPERGAYILIGWGWYDDYVPGQVPELNGVNDDEWFIHESGYHMLNGDMVLTPPAEGQETAEAPSMKKGIAPKGAMGSHPRVWDTHMWRTDLVTGADTAPVTGLEHPLFLESLLPQGSMVMTGQREGTAFFYPASSGNSGSMIADNPVEGDTLTAATESVVNESVSE